MERVILFATKLAAIVGRFLRLAILGGNGREADHADPELVDTLPGTTAEPAARLRGKSARRERWSVRPLLRFHSPSRERG